MNAPNPDRPSGHRRFLRDTLALLILKSLAWGPRHGYAVMEWLESRSDGALTIDEGALYPALHRLEARGLLAATWGESAAKRRAKFYRLTARGRAALADEERAWARHASGVARILEAGS